MRRKKNDISPPLTWTCLKLSAYHIIFDRRDQLSLVVLFDKALPDSFNISRRHKLLSSTFRIPSIIWELIPFPIAAGHEQCEVRVLQVQQCKICQLVKCVFLSPLPRLQQTQFCSQTRPAQKNVIHARTNVYNVWLLNYQRHTVRKYCKTTKTCTSSLEQERSKYEASWTRLSCKLTTCSASSKSDAIMKRVYKGGIIVQKA